MKETQDISVAPLSNKKIKSKIKIKIENMQI
jgi:hypothetical protein